MRTLLRALRFDGLWWRKFAYLGSVYFPEWWKRGSPPWIAAIIFACVGRNRRGAVANMRRVLGRHGWLRDYWNGLKVFIAFAHCMTETLEYFSPRPQPLAFEEPDDDPIGRALGEGRGAVLVTCHFGNWDVGGADAGALRPSLQSRDGARGERDHRRLRPPRPRVAGVRVLLSDSSVYGLVQHAAGAAARTRSSRMQLDRPLGGDGARAVEFFGAPALFQAGPLRLARLAGSPIFPVFVVRVGRRRYRIVLGSERRVARTRASRRWTASSAASSASSRVSSASTPTSGFSSSRSGPSTGRRRALRRRRTP